MGKNKYISNIDAIKLKALYDIFKETEEYEKRNKQRTFCSIAKDVLCYMVQHHKFTPDSITTLVHLFSVKPKMAYIEEGLKKIADNDADFVNMYKQFKECEYRGFTAVGRSKIDIDEDDAKYVEQFISEIIDSSTKEEVQMAVNKYNEKNVPFCTVGIYSPWLHYIHPKLCPIANGQDDSFLDFLNVSKNRKNDYLFMLDLFEEALEATGAEDYSLLDEFMCNANFEENVESNCVPNIWLWLFDRTDTIQCGSGWKKKGSDQVLRHDVGIYKTKDEFYAAFREQTGKRCSNLTNSYWEMYNNAKIGDIVLACHGRQDNKIPFVDAYAWGVITSEYIYNPDKNCFITRKVEWKDEKQTPLSIQSMILYFKRLDDHKYISKAIEYFDIPLINRTFNTDMQYQEYIELLKENHNLVLTGAPGTGKTYMAKAIAKEMEAETEFVQFHPSYDYTDFVEGLRPIEKGEDQVGFRRMDGIFKKFCKKAIINEATEDNNVLAKLNSDPKIWKVSLGGTYENPTRTDCLANGYIRIGWHEYGDVDDFNDYQDFTVGGKAILRAFQSQMKVGDIIVSCYSQYETDAIGIVTGDYEFREEGGEFPRYRTVEWLIKDVRINIYDIIGKKMTLSTVYKFDISAPEILKLVKGQAALTEQPVPKDKPYVMIIDEINRGELSKIFGELFYAIDPGYRGETGRVKTQYQNLVDEGDVFAKGFYVPENVYILATMNDIDRSVESMDFAMRRRFTWKEITPKDTMSMLDSELDASLATSAKAYINRLNDEIASTEGLGEAFMIGPSYFLKLNKYNGDFDKLWRLNIEPLLKEYLRGFRKASEKLKEFRNIYFCETTDDTENTQDEVIADDEN